MSVYQVAERICSITRRKRATNDSAPISCDEIAKEVNIEQNYGGIEQKFTIDENVLIAGLQIVSIRVVSALDQHSAVVLTAQPGAGKSWFIENLQD